MAIALGCIADDYTGASDLANTLSRQGLRTIQTIGIPGADLDLPEADAIVVSPCEPTLMTLAARKTRMKLGPGLHPRIAR